MTAQPQPVTREQVADAVKTVRHGFRCFETAILHGFTRDDLLELKSALQVVAVAAGGYAPGASEIDIAAAQEVLSPIGGAAAGALARIVNATLQNLPGEGAAH